jgi:tetratricopeptide (TPR) repeat protein
MHNYDEIEKIYYKRKTRKYIVITISLLIILIATIYLSKHYMHTLVDKSSNKIKIEKKEDKDITPKTINKSNIKEDKLTLDSQIPKINIPKNTSTQEPKIKNKPVKKPIEKQKNEKAKLKIVVVQKSQKLNDLLNYYKSFKDYETAIEIANIYYKNKDYHNSITWAKKANDLNAKDVQSWLIYAKSLVALNKKIKAETLLKLYLEIYGPNKTISSYLRSIK